MNIQDMLFSPRLTRRKNGLFVSRFGLILAKFEAPAKPQKITKIL